MRPLSVVVFIFIFVLLFTPAVVLGEEGLLGQVRAGGALRVCADPDNLPFSSNDAAAPGYDVEVAEEIARGLGGRAEVTWVSTRLGRSAIRQLLDGKCDLFMGLPADPRFLDENPRLALSKPYYTLSHVFVSPAARPVRGLSDLGDRKVAVEGLSMGDIFLFKAGAQRESYRTQRRAFDAVVRGEAEAALLWAPIAWWLLKTVPGARFLAVEVSGPDLQFPLGVGLRKRDPELLGAVDTVITRLLGQGKLEEILRRYGAPSPLRTGSAPERRAPRIILAQAAAPPVDPKIRLGRSLYFQMCAPCHGPDASGGGPVKDMKKFEGNEEEFVRTAIEGRGTKGMPSWKGDLSEDEIRAIRAFVLTIPR